MRQEWWKPCSKFRESLLKCFITYRVTTRCSIEWQTPFALPSSATCICYNKQLKRRMRFGDFWRHKGTEGRVIKTIFLFSLRNIQRHFHWETYHTMSTKREKEKKDIFFSLNLRQSTGLADMPFTGLDKEYSKWPFVLSLPLYFLLEKKKMHAQWSIM